MPSFIGKVVKPVANIASGFFPSIGGILAKGAGAVIGGVGSAVGAGLGRKVAGAVGLGAPSPPKPPPPKTPEQSAADTNTYLDKVFPGTNPWERLGVNAQSPIEAPQVAGRAQLRLQEQQLKTQAAIVQSQLQNQLFMQHRQLSQADQLKRAELANTKSIAKIQARSAVHNANINPEARAELMANVLDGEPVSAGTLTKMGAAGSARTARMQAEAGRDQANVAAKNAYTRVDELSARWKELDIKERYQKLQEAVQPIMAHKQTLHQFAGGFLSKLEQEAIRAVKSGNLESLKELFLRNNRFIGERSRQFLQKQKQYPK